uniref:Uncharacterized protein n=1 Tax=Anguilla anguilla TaxID=7936 RepID=A0A0E9WMY3_ANGAN
MALLIPYWEKPLHTITQRRHWPIHGTRLHQNCSCSKKCFSTYSMFFFNVLSNLKFYASKCPL